jgi:PAS domain S-box-containing protein
MLREIRTDEKIIARLFSSHPDAIAWFIPVFADAGEFPCDFKIRYCNDAACNIFGKEATAISGASLTDSTLFEKSSIDAVTDRCSEAWRSGECVPFTYYSQMEKSYSVECTKVNDGLLWMMRAQSSERTSENTIGAQTQLLNLMLNSSLNGVYLLDAIRDNDGIIRDFIITHANEVFCSLSGRKREDILGKSFLKTFPDTVQAGIFRRNCEILETGEAVSEVFRYHGDGVDRWYENLAQKVTEDQLVITFHDVTDLKIAAIRLQESNTHLLKSNERLSEFSHIVSHDLNEPLRKIHTYSDIIHEKYRSELQPELLSYLHKIEKTTRRMQGLIKDLLTYSQVSYISRTFEKISLNTVVNDVLNDLESVINLKSARCNVGPLPELYGDKTQLGQIFQNLISNALKFQKKDEAPFIQISQQPEVTKNGIDYYCIAVKDNGIGFDSAYTSRIFQVFQRLHTKNDYEGTGIGLAIVQKAVENHSGHIEVASIPGAGTTFYIYLKKSEAIK